MAEASMEHVYRIGKTIAIGAIAATVVAILMVNVSALMIRASAPILEFPAGLVLWLLILTCAQFYAGSNWARWIVGGFLVLAGAYWSYVAITPSATPVTAFQVVFVGVAIFSLVSGTATLTAGHVRHFLTHQQANPNPVAGRVLRALWLVAGLVVVAGVALDVERLLR